MQEPGRRSEPVFERRVNARIFSSVSQGVIITDAKQKILNVNDAFLSITGYSKDEIVGRSCRFLQGPLSDGVSIKAIQDSIDGGVDYSGEIVNYRKDGQTFWNELTISPVRDDRGTITHFVGITRDISERKTAQANQQKNLLQLQALSRRVLQAQETERRRVANELHDELGQSLTAIKINLQSYDRVKNKSFDELNNENIRIVDDAIQQVRRLSLALRPSMLDDLGLVPALKWVTEQTAQRSGLDIRFQSTLPKIRLNHEIETACFRVTQEALTNIVRHAHPEHVRVDIGLAADDLVLAIEDDGAGFEVDQATRLAKEGASVGVLGMRERASLIGGALAIESAKGAGTRVRLTCPLRLHGDEE